MKSHLIHKILASLAILLHCAVAVAQEADPFEFARQGYLECGEFDEASKTCDELASYTERSDGKFDLISRQLIERQPQLVFISSMVAFNHNGMICGIFSKDDFDFSKFTKDGKELGADDAMILRNSIRPSMAELFGKTSCMRVTDKNGVLETEYVLDGKVLPGVPKGKIKWVKPDDGFTLPGEPD